MSGIEIDHGGAISVDPDDLRSAAGRMGALTALYEDAQGAVVRACAMLADAPEVAAQVGTGALHAGAASVRALRAECAEAVTGTLLMADVYEYVELQAAAEAGEIRDAAYAESLHQRMEQLAASDERILPMAASLIAGWERDRFEGLGEQSSWGGLMAPLFSTAALLGARAGLGKVLPGRTLSGTADAVKVTAVATSTPKAPPAGFADALRGFAKAPDAQIRIEKYTFAGGPPKYVAYLKGTQSPGFGGTEPWDMKSNAELYTGQTSASYQATLDALAAAGVKPGDEVNVVAHSQSGMIAAHLAMESEYDVKMQITAGSPVEPTLDEDQTLVQLGHTDDFVRALAGGGSPGGTGSPESISVTAVDAPPLPWDGIGEQLKDPVSPHLTESYVEMAEQVDASGDPRVEAMDEFWTGLAQAERIESTDYLAVRTDVVSSAARLDLPHQLER
ncbi:hypothetical protein [Microbacterium sp. SD291]|uniref:hypothetical protein n=1 Tax=Microbacterium sp. SD291 TaxID=2782007 RepID=UPI001A959A72|nr:hypothetical protein [Microbacterium sp. SD291]MBO0980213.1 hypothetical protein [Microbacterium sp. SD291]